MKFIIPPPIVVDLTQKQVAELAQHFETLADMDSADEPGMFIAQIFRDHMKCGLIDKKHALLIQSAVGAKVGAMLRRAKP